MTDKMTITLELENIGNVELSCETDLQNAPEKIPYVAQQIATMMMQQLIQVLDSGETHYERTITSRPEQENTND
ncbi:hypothetical protein VVR12_01715 [Rothia sp. LK2588]|uniref:hypothetical protein n=1 Tax=Rothia sp. LK2588 TaxID=3114369 RepID=UPI0034CD16EB